MNCLRVNTPTGAYPIFVGPGLLTQAGEMLAGLDSGANALATSCAVITNLRVGETYAPRLAESLRTRHFEPRVIQMPDGEVYKTLDTVRQLYDQLIEARLERHSPIFALGGGVVGDVAGFVAATYLRGVPFIQVPTTLLAMVDASIGGKVAVDHPRGKNLIGAFKQPHAVIADTDTLATLPAAEFRAGMAEVVKHAVIGDAELFERLETGIWKSEVGTWIERAMRVKVDIVERDPFEMNERARLNLGHTFGHALENLSNHAMRHGDAVAIGMACAARLAARIGVCDVSLATRLSALLHALGLPTRVPHEFSATALLDAMQTDKKRLNARRRFVLPRALGDVVLADAVAEENVIAALEESR